MKDNVKGTCLIKAIVLYILLNKLGHKPYVVIFKPHGHKGVELHAAVAIFQDGIVLLDPLADRSRGFSHVSMGRCSNLDEFNKEIGVIVTFFNEREVYVRI